jgi:hypothetical protein
VLIALALLAALVAAAVMVLGSRVAEAPAAGPTDADYVTADRLVAHPIPPAGPAASTGSWVERCGLNQNAHRNSDNVVSSPQKPGAALHLHDYVGNDATSASSTDAELQAAATTCTDGDRSTYYWPVLRLIGPGSGPASPPVAGNTGRVLPPDSVLVQFRGNQTSRVLPMAILTRAITGNARALTSGGANTERVQWGCSGRPGYSTKSYPICPAGQQVLRTFDFPSCWDGRRIDSPTHRAHIVFPNAAGACPAETFPVPQLHLVISYSVPAGHRFAIDSRPDQRRSPLSDHCDFINIMSDALMSHVAGCINSGRHC